MLNKFWGFLEKLDYAKHNVQAVLARLAGPPLHKIDCSQKGNYMLHLMQQPQRKHILGMT